MYPIFNRSGFPVIRILCLTFVLCSQAFSQEKSVLRTGLLSAGLTLSPAYMFGDGESYFYLHGGLEGYVSGKVSLTGDGSYYLGSSAETSHFAYNHSLFFGASRHFTANGHDFYIGLQPGLSFTRLSEGTGGQSQPGVNAVISPAVGYNFYMEQFFHFFVQARLVAGQHNTDMHRSLTEFRICAGLGFNINTMK